MDWIQGEKFIDLADNVKIFYCHTTDVNNFFNTCDKTSPFILVSHNSDAVVTDNPRQINSVPFGYHADIKLMPDNCIRWFAQNIEIENDRLESIPIGLENNYCNPSLMKNYKLSEIVKTEKSIKNLVYLNFNINNNIERGYIYDILKDKPYVTTEYGRNGLGFDNYLYNLYNHKFMVCPEGNGIDVHQPWESLYINTIPIQKKNTNNKNWRELPICWVDDWKQIEDEDFLISEYDRITNNEFDKSKLYFEYWKDKIKKSI